MSQAAAVAGEWCVANAEELRALLAGFLKPGEDIDLDLAGVERCDAAALQLFCSLRRTARDRGLRPRRAAALGLGLDELEADDGL